MRLMGKREIGQLQPFELAIAIMIEMVNWKLMIVVYMIYMRQLQQPKNSVNNLKKQWLMQATLLTLIRKN